MRRINGSFAPLRTTGSAMTLIEVNVAPRQSPTHCHPERSEGSLERSHRTGLSMAHGASIDGPVRRDGSRGPSLCSGRQVRAVSTIEVNVTPSQSPTVILSEAKDPLSGSIARDRRWRTVRQLMCPCDATAQEVLRSAQDDRYVKSWA